MISAARPKSRVASLPLFSHVPFVPNPLTRMKTPSLLRRLLAAAVPLLFLASAASAQQQATILKLVGQGATVLLPDGRSVDAEVGLKVPETATIRSGSAEVYLEAVSGAIAAIKPDSQVVVLTLSGNDPTLELKEIGRAHV